MKLPMVVCIFAVREPTKPLNDAQMCGAFLYYGLMATRIPFIKTYSTPKELVHLLKTRAMALLQTQAKARRRGIQGDFRQGLRGVKEIVKNTASNQE